MSITDKDPIVRVLAAAVSVDDANQALNYFASREGYPAGSFTLRLQSAMGCADSENLARLRAVFPGIGSAMTLAMSYARGLDVLRDIAEGGETA